MNVSQEDARDSLTEIQDLMKKTRRAISSGCASTLLILWGIIWVLGFSGTQLFPRQCGFIWLCLNTGGFIATLIIAVHAPVKSEFDKRLFWLWLLLFIYADLWLVLLRPWNYLQLGAFASTIPMFAYVVMGLWLKDFIIWLGLAVTVLIVIGYFLLQPIFWIWMAVCGGGSLILTGLYIRKFWR